MKKKNRWFSYKGSPVFNTFIHVGMLIRILVGIGMLAAVWYFFDSGN